MFASLNSVFIQSIANNVFSDETSLSNDDYVKKTAIKLIERHVDAPFISVLAGVMCVACVFIYLLYVIFITAV